MACLAKLRKIAPYLYWGGLFLAILIFFTEINPLIVFDGDDWMYLYYPRLPLPVWKSWNPTRIFPEIAMPFCGSIGAYLIHPFLKDYVMSVAIACGLFLTICIMVYIYAVARLLESKVGISRFRADLIATCFYCLHFIIFRGDTSGNEYMLRAQDTACYFYYIIPTILNVAMVCLLEGKPKLVRWGGTKHSRLGRGMLYMVLYLLICSNLYCSWILAIWAGWKLLGDGLRERKRKNGEKWKQRCSAFAKAHGMLLFIDILWVISAFYEFNGARAGEQSFTFGEYLSRMQTVITHLFSFLLPEVGRYFAEISVFLIALLLFVFWRRKKSRLEILRMYGWVAQNGMLGMAYLVLLCACVDPDYIARTDILLGASAWLFLGMVLPIAYVIREYPAAEIALPFLLLAFSWGINASSGTFRSSNYANLPWQVTYFISTDVVEQLVEADEVGETKIDVFVPSGLGEVWDGRLAEIPSYAADTLYHHRILSRKLGVTGVADFEKNAKYGITGNHLP